MPYKGSKNSIAKQIVDILPQADNLVDLFAGGCAITHCALTQDKYKHVYANDINDYPSMLIECFEGKHTTETHTDWIDRETFKREKEHDNYIKYCWSFGNNGKDYCYGKGAPTEWSFAMWEALFHNDMRYIESYGISTEELKSVGGGGIPDRKKYLDSVLKKYFSFGSNGHLVYDEEKFNGIDEKSRHRLISLERLIGLEQLRSASVCKRLESMINKDFVDNVSVSQSDYQAVEIPKNSIIYCDIPYYNTNGGSYTEFDHQRFYNWAAEQNNIFISEYNMPDDFVRIASFKKQINSSAQGSTTKSIEGLFTNKKTAEKYNFPVQE